ncbi:MAG: hypothetical protein LUE98_04230 [Tannerellaceae bacterium]|nr:hypothetical protein [Tannerellaceae bacterium]
MKKYLLLYPLFLIFPFLFVACDDDDDDDYYDYFENLIFPDSSERYQNLYADDNGGTVYFEAKRNWTISIIYDNYDEDYTEQDWLRVDKTSGQPGRITLNYMVDENLTRNDRDCYIRIICGNDEADIVIRQFAENGSGEVNGMIIIDWDERDKFTYADDEEGFIHFEARGSWSAYVVNEDFGEPFENWLTIDNSDGESGTVTLRYITEKNMTKNTRHGRIMLICADDEVEVFVTQFEYDINGNLPTHDLSEYGFVNQIDVRFESGNQVVNSSYRFSYEDYIDYRISQINYDSDVNSMHIVIPEMNYFFETSIGESFLQESNLSLLQEIGLWTTAPLYRHREELVKAGHYITNVRGDADFDGFNTFIRDFTFEGYYEYIKYDLNQTLFYSDKTLESLEGSRNSSCPIYDPSGFWSDNFYFNWRCVFRDFGNEWGNLDINYSDGVENYNKNVYAKYESNIPNSTKVNIDLNGLIYADPYFGKIDGCRDLFSILSLYGKRNSYLVSASGDEITGREWSYNYKLNDNGFVEQVTVTNNYNDSKIVYTIQYLGQ